MLGCEEKYLGSYVLPTSLPTRPSNTYVHMETEIVIYTVQQW